MTNGRLQSIEVLLCLIRLVSNVANERVQQGICNGMLQETSESAKSFEVTWTFQVKNPPAFLGLKILMERDVPQRFEHVTVLRRRLRFPKESDDEVLLRFRKQDFRMGGDDKLASLLTREVGED